MRRGRGGDHIRPDGLPDVEGTPTIMRWSRAGFSPVRRFSCFGAGSGRGILSATEPQPFEALLDILGVFFGQQRSFSAVYLSTLLILGIELSCLFCWVFLLSLTGEERTTSLHLGRSELRK